MRVYQRRQPGPWDFRGRPPDVLVGRCVHRMSNSSGHRCFFRLFETFLFTQIKTTSGGIEDRPRFTTERLSLSERQYRCVCHLIVTWWLSNCHCLSDGPESGRRARDHQRRPEGRRRGRIRLVVLQQGHPARLHPQGVPDPDSAAQLHAGHGGALHTPVSHGNCTVEGKSKWHHQVFQDSFLLKRQTVPLNLTWVAFSATEG